MTTETRNNSFMAFIVGGLVVAVGVIAYFVFAGGDLGFVGGGDTTIKIESSASGSSGDASGGAAGGAAGGEPAAGGGSESSDN